jgi:O-antigen/teichoic acid export membrane protein
LIPRNKPQVLTRNLIANYIGQGWVALMGLCFVPTYIEYLGIEAYGLIGLFALLLTILSLLDLGVTPTLNREMARFTAGAHTAKYVCDLLRTLEICSFIMASFIALVIALLSSWLASDWLRVDGLSLSDTTQSIAIMGVVAGLRFSEGIYRGAILGLQKQVFFNIANAFLATVRALGAIAVLAWISPTIEAFFIWQGFVSIFTVGLLGAYAHLSLPSIDRRAKFSLDTIKDIWRFSGGVLLTAVLAVLLTQIDKIILSTLIDLRDFGYYTLATAIVTLIGILIAPITQAYYPRFTELVECKSQYDLINTYHQSCQLVTILIAPIAFTLFFFGEDLLLLWTGNPALAHSVAPLLSLLAIGTMLNGLMHIPFMLQLAHGRPDFAIWINLIAVFFLVPAILLVTPQYGAIGAAWIWIVLNAAYVLIGVQFMYRQLLPGEKWRWYIEDVSIPIIVAASILFSCRTFFVEGESLLLDSIFVITCTVFAILGTMISTKAGRLLLTAFIWKYKNVK